MKRENSVEAAPRSTVAGALKWAAAQLAPGRTASLDSELLLAHVLERSRSWIIGHDRDFLSGPALATFRSLVQRRVQGEPVAYLRGYVEWFGMLLEVNAATLIPRPDTEVLAERAIALARERGATLVVDVGTGSGAVAIAIARALDCMQVTATDVSGPALEVARRNIATQGVAERVRPAHGWLLAAIPVAPDLIVANLPYLSTDMMEALERDVRYEPRVALHGGETGLELYDALICEMIDRGWSVPLIVEIDPRQAALMRLLVAERMPRWAIGVYPDYAGLDRVVVISPPAGVDEP